MPISLPNLDDRSFDDLMAQMRSVIPRYARTWTDHNPSDPGITLLELLAWLTEIVLYRTNQIHERSYRNFLELLGVEPLGIMAEITFKIEATDENNLPTDFTIDHGTRVSAQDENTGGKIIFETLRPVGREDKRWDGASSCLVFKVMAVNTEDVTDEALGTSDGSANQTFALRRGPVFLNKEFEYHTGNPLIVTNSGSWSYKNDLLDSQPDSEDFTVEHLSGLIRFGDGTKGSIPPAGEEILCTYRRLSSMSGDLEAGRIDSLEGTISGIDASRVTVTNEYTVAGARAEEGLDDMLSRGLKELRERYRAVSGDDFEDLVEIHFKDKVARVKAVPDRDLIVSDEVKDAHMSLIVLPSEKLLFSSSTDTGRACHDLTSAMQSVATEELRYDIKIFIEPRRLITTFVHVVMPGFDEISLDIAAKAKLDANLTDVREQVEKKINRFLDPYHGGEDGGGWPFGRDIYRSELYQQIESIEGVDYVERMLMNGDPSNSLIKTGKYSLVCLKALAVSVH